jgi:hypothetical protein
VFLSAAVLGFIAVSLALRIRPAQPREVGPAPVAGAVSS